MGGFTLHYIAFTLHYISSYYIALHPITSHHIKLLYIALHYVALRNMFVLMYCGILQLQSAHMTLYITLHCLRLGPFLICCNFILLIQFTQKLNQPWGWWTWWLQISWLRWKVRQFRDVVTSWGDCASSCSIPHFIAQPVSKYYLSLIISVSRVAECWNLAHHLAHETIKQAFEIIHIIFHFIHTQKKLFGANSMVLAMMETERVAFLVLFPSFSSTFPSYMNIFTGEKPANSERAGTRRQWNRTPNPPA